MKNEGEKISCKNKGTIKIKPFLFFSKNKKMCTVRILFELLDWCVKSSAWFLKNSSFAIVLKANLSISLLIPNSRIKMMFRVNLKDTTDVSFTALGYPQFTIEL